jgi:hypothetical protein
MRCLTWPARFNSRYTHLDGVGEAVVHGESLAAPVSGRAQRTHLRRDAAAVLLLPLPHLRRLLYTTTQCNSALSDLCHECLAPQIVARNAALLGQPLLHHRLRGDAGVVGAGQPQRGSAGHAVPPGQAVLDGVCEGVAQVQRARHVGGRDDHHEPPALARRLCRAHVRLVEALRRPPGVPRRLHRLRVVRCQHLAAHVCTVCARHDVGQ